MSAALKDRIANWEILIEVESFDDELRDTFHQLAEIFRRFCAVSPDVCQLIDGWQQSESWSEWDKSIRQRLAELNALTEAEGQLAWRESGPFTTK